MVQNAQFNGIGDDAGIVEAVGFDSWAQAADYADRLEKEFIR
jgi:hypothetical protein